MARTPLAHALRRLSRRALLVGAAAGAASAACGPRAPMPATKGPEGVANAGSASDEPRPFEQGGRAAPPPPAEVDVAIVGAGLAGLTCARRLAQAKVTSVVFEAASVVGGRVRTDRTTFGDTAPIELGGEFIDTAHERLRALVAELGLVTDDVEEAAAGLAPSYYFQGRAFTENELATALRPALVAAARDARSAFGPDPASHRAQVELDAMPLERWLKERGIGGVAASLITAAYVTEMGLDASEVSTLCVLEGLGIRDSRLVLYGASDERYRVRGGNDQVPKRVAESLPEPVRTGHALEAVRRNADGRYLLTFRRGGKSLDVRAARVVLALPFTRLREVELHESTGVPASKRAAIAELAYGANAKTILGFSKRFWTSAQRSGELYTDLSLQCTWDATRAVAGEGGALTIYRGGREATRACQGDLAAERARSLEEVSRVFPGALPLATRAVRAPWPLLDIARGSYSTWRAGQRTAFFEILPKADGGLHYAGEHTSLKFQGFMEGAVESGERAAREILRIVGRPLPKTLPA